MHHEPSRAALASIQLQPRSGRRKAHLKGLSMHPHGGARPHLSKHSGPKSGAALVVH